ncbi:hypothetical protein A359_00940 [secondary endosymbiont of Ctenarytaina eucalypti]|uniref:Uncharacterized protein n=1 Tax=secondary endosymbiont of Ctenarytaina eucalypti TaxID=1199245 RepID=J3YR65_9ENTR|nr:hypothetical protein A359_00940 [secondary endosymbiont of Ctenarytaina eucalypti]
MNKRHIHLNMRQKYFIQWIPKAVKYLMKINETLIWVDIEKCNNRGLEIPKSCRALYAMIFFSLIA